MKLPVLHGVIDRRILINYRIEPDVVRSLLPPHLQPLLVNGYASGGVCLIRLKDIGLKYTPSIFRITSENAAYRFLVTWKGNNGLARGVYIPRRNSDSWLNVMVAGRIFAWPHHAARFFSAEANGCYSLRVGPHNGPSELEIDGHRTDHFPKDSMFRSLGEASRCLRIANSVYHLRRTGGALKRSAWKPAPVGDTSCRR